MWVLLDNRKMMESYQRNSKENKNRWIVEIEHSKTKKGKWKKRR